MSTAHQDKVQNESAELAVRLDTQYFNPLALELVKSEKLNAKE